MKTSEATSFVSHYLHDLYGAGRQWIGANPRFVKIGLAAAASFCFVGALYRRLHQSDVLPFDHWSITLGLVSRKPGPVKPDNLHQMIAQYSPQQLASYLYAYLLQTPSKRVEIEPQSPQDWLNWMASRFTQRSELLPVVEEISPTYHEEHVPSPEDANTLAVQTWATNVQQWVAFLGWSTFSMPGTIFESIRSSPRFVYTILFHFTASFVTQKIWESIEDPLPPSLAVIKDFYMNHRFSIGCASLAVVGFFFYRMRQEKGIVRNLTQSWLNFERGHKRYDLIDSYREGMNQVLNTIGRTTPGERGSNIIWYYQRQAHQTFGEEIGEALAEVTAAGRVYRENRTPVNCPHLKNLQVLELDLDEFLAEHATVDAIKRGWHETMKHVAEAGNVIVVLKKPYLLADHLLHGNRSPEMPNFRGGHEDPVQCLARHVTVSLEQKQFRCLLVLDEQEKEMIQEGFAPLFTKIKAPNLTTEEEAALCTRLYAKPEVGQLLSTKDIDHLFRRMKPTLDVAPFPPADILYALTNAQWEWEQSWKHLDGNRDQVIKIEKAESRLREAQHLKEQLLQKIWEVKRTGQEEPLPLLQAVVMVDKVLLPLYAQAVAEAKQNLASAEPFLVNAVQRRFKRFFGPCAEQEKKRLKELPDLLKQKIRGQDPAIEAIGTAVERWRMVPPLDRRPLVVFLSGPAGAGKTQVTTQLAYHLNYVYGIADSVVHTQEKNLQRFYLNRETPGAFLGWDVIKIQILQFIRENPTAVIVFEEWDKMPEGERSSLLEILEGTQSYIEGTYTQNRDRPFVEKRCVTFVLVANTAEDVLSKPAVGDPKECFLEDTKMLKQRILDAFKEKPAEGNAFISRLNGIIPFRGISDKAGKDLIDKYLNEYAQQGILTPAQYEDVKAKIPAGLHDGRDLQRAVEQAIYEVINRKNNV